MERGLPGDVVVRDLQSVGQLVRMDNGSNFEDLADAPECPGQMRVFPRQLMPRYIRQGNDLVQLVEQGRTILFHSPCGSQSADGSSLMPI